MCNGSNGTPDLRNRFLTGAGSSYALGATGGENTHTLTIPELPSHNHPLSGNLYGLKQFQQINGCKLFAEGTAYSTRPDLLVYYVGDFSSITCGNTGGNQPHENRPPFYAVYYIMKMK